MIRARDFALVLVLAVLVALATIAIVGGFTRGPVASAVDAFTLSDLVWPVAQLGFAGVGLLIVSRQPRNAMGWVLAGLGSIGIISAAANDYALRALLVDRDLPFGPELLWLSQAAWGSGTLFALALLYFPNGTLPSRRWRPLAWLAGASIVIALVTNVIAWPDRGVAILKNPNEIPGSAVGTLLLQVGFLLQSIVIVLAAASLVARFRRAGTEERQQIKWLAYSGAVLVPGVILFFIEETQGLQMGPLPDLVLSIAVVATPAAMAIAVLKYRLYDIDVVINRTLVYATLTSVLAGAYVALVFGLQALLAPVTEESDLAVAASTLAVAGLFRPLRSRVQDFIDRRFYRRKFDIERTLEDFTSRVRDQVDLASLSAQLTEVVADTLQPATISLWLRIPGGGVRP